MRVDTGDSYTTANQASAKRPSKAGRRILRALATGASIGFERGAWWPIPSNEAAELVQINPWCLSALRDRGLLSRESPVLTTLGWLTATEDQS